MESIDIKGEVSIRGFNSDGEQVLSIDKRNLVVTTGKQRMAQLLAEGSADFVVDGIAFGTGAGTPSLSDTHSSITNIFQKAIAGSSYPTANKVKFDWTLEYSENNGVTIREFGLVSGLGAGDEALFARIVTDPIAKTSGLRLTGSWTITF